MENLYDFGIALIQALQTLSPTLDAPMKLFTFMGTVEFYLLLIPFIYWNVNSRLGFRILLALVVTDFLGVAFKLLLHEPRPYWIGEVKTLAQETSYGIPSTHSSDSLVVWGLLALHFRRRWMWILSVLLVLLIATSRLYLGVHFPQDVIGGWILAGIVLLVYWRYEAGFSRWLLQRSMAFRIGLGFLTSILIIAAGLVVLAITSSIPDPPSFASYATQARSPAQFITLGGALFGAVLGYELMRQQARFKIHGSWINHILRYLLGISGLLAIYLGLDILFGMLAADETAIGQVLRYLRYAAVTWFATYGAPGIFLQLRLVEREG
jgi:membrane-associated phospholipid phosphatase